jgi:alpha-glucosidase
MPWRADAPHGGFTDAEPWLPTPDAHLPLAVDRQAALPGSTLNRMRRFLKWRRGVAPLRAGEMTFIDAPEPLLGFERRLEGRAVVCLFNLGAAEVHLEADDDRLGATLDGHGFDFIRADGGVTLPPQGAFFGDRHG